MKIFILKPRNVLFFKGRWGRGDKIFSAENEELGQIIQSGDTFHTSEIKTKKIKIQFIDHLVITYSARIKIFPSVINGRCVLLKKTSAGLMNDKRWEKYSNISRNIMIIPHCLVGWRYTNTILSSYHTGCYIDHHSTDCADCGSEMFIELIFVFSFKSYSRLVLKWKSSIVD